MGAHVQQVAANTAGIDRVLPVKRLAEFKDQGDVVVDFSLPEALPELLKYCETHKVPLVSGTTGLSAQDKEALKTLSRKVPVLWSPNMSLGVMVVSKMLQHFAALSDWTFTMEETHHVHKKDKPSGTALRLKEVLESHIGKAIPMPEAFRRGEVIGDHKVLAQGPFEEISIEHKASDRRVFAQGAVQAALWLAGKPAGFYSLEDLVNA